MTMVSVNYYLMHSHFDYFITREVSNYFRIAKSVMSRILNQLLFSESTENCEKPKTKLY